jgi:hypothetical protein
MLGEHLPEKWPLQADFLGKRGTPSQTDSAEQLFASRRPRSASKREGACKLWTPRAAGSRISAQKIDAPPTFVASRDLASN